jgi:hypothetical protein
MSSFIKYSLAFLLGNYLAGLSLVAQMTASELRSQAVFDSLENRITYLQNQIPRLKQARDVAYYNLQRELDLTLFVKAYHELVVEEDLDNARKLVESRLERAEFRRDQYSISFYNNYKNNVFSRIKQQRIYYQALFEKEKTFRKEFDRYLNPGIQDNFKKLQRMVDLAIRYARENNLTETLAYLEKYKTYTQALIFDKGSLYDLAELTSSEKSFEKIFLPLVESDSLKDIKEAEILLSHCSNYAALTGSKLEADYLSRQYLVVASALSDVLESEGREKELERYTADAVKARVDSLNPCGVFKWHDQVVVIDEFIPSSAMENVKKGEAIIHADNMLAAYLKKNKVCQSVNDLKFGYAYVIPFKSNAKNSSFFYNAATQKWQYIVCYTSIVNSAFTIQAARYMPPLLFADEMNVAFREN